jgi:AbrB family looped-hinge helix DNA binding protein
MEQITVSSKGQIAIPKSVREALNLSEGTKLTLEVRGQEIVLSKEPAWKKLQGAGNGGEDLMSAFAAFKKQERESEDPRP